MTTAEQSKRRLAPAEKREALLDAAIHLFRSKGMAETTVEEITQSAGVAKGTFYLYFQTKEDLVGQLRVEFAQQIEQFFAASDAPDGSEGWGSYLAHLVESAVDLLLEERDLHDLLMMLPHAHEPGPLTEAMESTHAALVAILQRGSRAGALDVIDAGATAWLLLDLIQTAGDRASTDMTNAGRYRRTCSTAVQRWLLRPGAR